MENTQNTTANEELQTTESVAQAETLEEIVQDELSQLDKLQHELAELKDTNLRLIA